MNLEDVIKQKIVELENKRQEFLTQVSVQVAFYDGEIAILKELLDKTEKPKEE